MAIAIIVYLALMTLLGVLSTVGSVGKPRKPISNGQAAGVTFVAMVHLAAFAYLSTQLY